MKSFRGYRLDTVNHCLWRGEDRLLLSPKVFDVLRYLVEHSDRLVTQEEMLEALWPDTYVNPEVVKKYVLGIRKALGDDSANPAFVATFPRRGYQFVAPIEVEEAPAAKELTESGSKTIVGREKALARLQEALAKAKAGERQIVFLTGEAGIGKTTLVGAFEKRNRPDSDTRIARGYCIEGFEGKEAYYPVLDSLGQLFRGGDEREFAQLLAKRATSQRTTTFSIPFTAKFSIAGFPGLVGHDCTCSWLRGCRPFATRANRNWRPNSRCLSRAGLTTIRPSVI